jgi:glycosyltransferase involved in cell wall biosynthesis
MASAKPIISTEIVGVADDVKRYDAGRIVKPADERALAQAIMEILGDKDQAGKMGRRGRRLVEEKYTWKRVARDVLEIYREIL